MSIFKFNLGDQVQDVITKFKGIVSSRTEWFNGCIRYGVDSQEMKDGRPIDGVVFDEAQIKLVKASAVPSPAAIIEKPVLAPAKPVARTGGPRNDSRAPVKSSMERSRR